ncbi:MAG: HAD-IB family hydrolase [Patulibacter minatonensis]
MTTVPTDLTADRAPAPRTDLRAAAFFDLDRTLVSGSSGFSILIEMARAGIVTRRQLLRDTWVSARFRLWGLDDATTDAVRTRVGGYVKDVPSSDLEAISGAVLERVLPRVYPSVLARVHAHQQAGEPVYLVTASSQEFADLFAEVLDLDGAVGTRSEIIDGVYTGQPGGPFVYGEGKVEALADLAAEHGLALSASTAYSDSISDLPMLRAVGTPVAVNPDRALRRIAADEHWEVLAVDRLAHRLRTAGAAAAGLTGAALVVRALRPRGARAS